MLLLSVSSVAPDISSLSAQNQHQVSHWLISYCKLCFYSNKCISGVRPPQLFFLLHSRFKMLATPGIRNPIDNVLHKNQNALIQRLLCKDKVHVRQINEQCQKIEDNAATNSVKDLYQGVISLTNKFRTTVDTIKNENSEILYVEAYVEVIKGTYRETTTSIRSESGMGVKVTWSR